MTIKSAVASRVMAYLTGPRRESGRRARAERRRVRAGGPHVVEYFHQVDDPYSHLAVQALGRIRSRYDIELRPWLVGEPADWAAPERERLIAYARSDAARLARRADLDFRDPGRQPAPAQVAAAAGRLAAVLESSDFFDVAQSVGGAMWSGRELTGGPHSGHATEAIEAGTARRARLGHFMSGMLHYAGEWYWGVDRLHYLETRLAALGARRPDAPAAPLYEEPLVPVGRASRPVPADPSAAGDAVQLHFYLSFRSPYTAIAVDRVKALADAYGATLELRFVLPMVMRGLPVPRMKGFYFALDTAREARRAGVPFGRIADPVGRPVERGYSLLPWARAQGRGYEYCRAFLRGAWAEGVDAGSDAGLRRIVEAAGLSWQAARPLVGNDDWRAEAEANRTEMLDLGLWGVPCFRVGPVATWGQDRLWVIEEELERLAGRRPADGEQDGASTQISSGVPS